MSPFRCYVAVVCLGLGLCAIPALAAEPEPAPAQTPAPTSPGPSYPYQVQIKGVEKGPLLDLLRKTSHLLSFADRPPATRAGLDRRIQSDVERFQDVLRSQGYYAGSIATTVDGSASPPRVVVDVKPGAQYKLTRYALRYEPEPPPGSDLPPDMKAVGVELGKPARAAEVVDAQRRLIARLGRLGHPLAKVVDRRSVVDPARRSLAVTLTVNPGPAARFGPVTITGLKDVDEAYVRRLLRWKEGEPFDAETLDQGRRALRETRLFSSVSVRHADEVDARGRLPVTVAVQERKPRSVGLGLKYSSAEGPGGEAFWTHRNLFGQGESLRARILGSEIDQEGSLEFRKPNIWRLDQDLVARSALVRNDYDAYKKHGIESAVRIDRKLDRLMTVSGGVSFDVVTIEQRGDSRDFAIVGLPLAGRLDDTDDKLDPKRGYRVGLTIEPAAGRDDQGENLRFVTTTLNGSVYRPLFGDERYILAGRAKFGTVAGEDTAALPADRRLYAGGGGSIRGYKFQSVGPLDRNNDPLGGRSLVELGAELRIRVTDEIGVVPFVDAGNVYDSVLPDPGRGLRVAAGLGLRYYTSIGPLRLDIGFPLNRRPGVDDRFQFYISLGQAF